MELERKKKRAGTARAVVRAAVFSLLLGILAEAGLCQFSFWTSLGKKGQNLAERAEIAERYVSAEEMEGTEGRKIAEILSEAPKEDEAEEGQSYLDEQGYLHVPGGSLLICVRNFDAKLQNLQIAADIPEGYQVLAEVFVQDEGNSYLYQLGRGRVLLNGVPENGSMKVYPYGDVKNLYIRLQRADAEGKGAGGSLGELVLRPERLEANAGMPFRFYPVRLLAWSALFLILYGLRAKSCLHQIPFLAESEAGRRRRLAAAALFTLLLLAGVFVFVRINPSCRENLALHHAQYQELAEAMAQGSFCVGKADAGLLKQENPYDTIALQAEGIPYRADYAYYEGNYYVYFGVIPVLLLYLPYYLLTGGALPNYAAVFLFFAGFVVACAGLMYELMRRYFPKLPFYLWGAGVFALTGSYSLFYLLIRPDLYHVPIIASHMFAAAGLWLYLAGLNRADMPGETAGYKQVIAYAGGSLCMALTAGCRPQFILFAALALVLFWKKICGKLRTGELLALVLPYAAAAGALMYYNAARFGSPFDFGAAYSLTSNDMTNRGFNLERVLYGLWYFLFQPPEISAEFPYLSSVLLETDYLGKMVTESSFGGVFATSLLFVPMLFLRRYAREGVLCRELCWFAGVSAALAVLIGAVDANGAGILIRYSCDVSFGLFLAAVPAMLGGAASARKKGEYGIFTAWLRASIVFQLAFLFLILINRDGSVNLLTGNPELYYSIQAALRW